MWPSLNFSPSPFLPTSCKRHTHTHGTYWAARNPLLSALFLFFLSFPPPPFAPARYHRSSAIAVIGGRERAHIEWPQSLAKTSYDVQWCSVTVARLSAHSPARLHHPIRHLELSQVCVLLLSASTTESKSSTNPVPFFFLHRIMAR